VAYRADIEIGVKGQEAIGRLQKQLDGTLNKINELNKTSVFRTGNVTQNIDRYVKQLDLANRAISLAAAGTDQETRAYNNKAKALGNLNAIQARSNYLLEQAIANQRKVQATANAGFGQQGPALPSSALKGFPSSPVGGGMNMPGSPAARSAQRKTFENVALGAGFPLLFGGGPGAVLGGAAGGLIPGSPMLSVVTSALGTQLDNIIKSTTDFSKSLRAGGDAAGFLEQKLGFLDPAVKKQIQNLQQSGQTAEAAKVAFNKLASEIGEDSAAGFLQAGKNAENLQNSFTKLTLSIVAAGFAFNKFLEDRKGFKFDINTLPGPFRPTQIPEEAATTAANRQKTTELKNQNTLLGLQVTLKGIDAKTDLNSYANIRRKVAQQEYSNELLKIANQLKVGEIGLDQNQLLIRAANLELAGKIKDIELDRTRQIAQNNEQAAQKAKQAADEESRILKSVASIRKDTLSTILEGVNAQFELDTLYKGESAVLKDRIKNAQNELDLKSLILDKEEEAALTAATDAREQAVIVKLFDQKAKLMALQASIQNKLNIDKARELQYTKDITAIQSKGNIQAAGTQATAAIAGARGNLARALGGTGFDFQQQQLNAEQQTQREALATRLEEINRMQQEVPLLTGDKKSTVEKDLANKQALLDIDTKRFNTLSAIEQQQLKVNQVTEQYGALATNIGNAFGTAFKGLIDGTMGVREAMQSLFADIASAFLDMAAQIIAKQMTMIILQTILKALGAVAGGVNSGGAGFDMGSGINSTGMSTFNPANSFKFATGGVFGSPTMFKFADGGTMQNGILGEAGPEAIMPLSRGAGGKLGVNASGLREAMGGAPGMGSSPVLNMSFETTRFGDTDYVSRDQLEAAMAQTRKQASADGAKRGMSMTLDRLQQSPQTRSRVGLR
jgi:phage-related minor tail protein